MNRSHIIGRFTRNPELKTLNDGTLCLHFTLAVDRPRNPQTHEKSPADFIPCVAWNGKAKTLANNCHKGSRIGVDGPLRSRVYVKDEQGADKKYIVEIRVDDFDFLDGKRKEDEAVQADQDDNSGLTGQPVPEAEIPIL